MSNWWHRWWAWSRILRAAPRCRWISAAPRSSNGVWQALQQIPRGQTASYADVAARIGAPRSSRAVARACASNPLAVAVPCHRVVRRDGDLSGYAWGVARKRELLRREKATTA